MILQKIFVSFCPREIMLVFISYNRDDRTFALRLRDKLREWGHSTWLDVDDIPPGDYWPDAIDNALKCANAVVAVFSPTSMTSRNCRNEWDWTIENHKPLIPLLWRECPISHRYTSINFIGIESNEPAGFAQLRTRLEAKVIETSYQFDAFLTKSIANSGHQTGVEKNRAILLRKVREFWIEGVLNPAKVGDVWLDLPADQRPEHIEPAIPHDLKNPDYPSITLTSGSQILDVFRKTGRALLILGAPGSGKTMTLLELAGDLLDEAEKHSDLPAPVVMNLASWAQKCADQLDEWLVERLFIDYGVSRKLAQRWINDGDLLFLLDGLDEVPGQHRDACVTAINNFWTQAGDWVDNGIVVCSRVEEYEKLSIRLRLENAVVLQPLALEQGAYYLERLGEDWSGLRTALLDNMALQKFAQSPLLLNIMAVAYQGLPWTQITYFNNLTEQQKHLFDHYIARRLRADKAPAHYNNRNTRHYLAWLANKMEENDQIIFNIESLQPNWIEDIQHKSYSLVVLSAIGLSLGSISGLSLVLFGALTFGLAGGLVGLLVGGLGIGIAVLHNERKYVSRIVVKEKLRWSWTAALEGIRREARKELIIGLSYALLVTVIIGLIFGPLVGTIAGLVSGLFFQLLAVLLFGLLNGLRRSIVELHTRPNQGIWQSGVSALLTIVLYGLIFGSIIGLVLGISSSFHVEIEGNSVLDPRKILIIAGLIGIAVGLNTGRHYGGRVVIQHIVLRYILFRNGDAPFNYAEFLDYCVSRHLLRRVGGGYIFRHRMLMEHFAEADW
jgi:DNA polymerase III delta prime subunit